MRTTMGILAALLLIIVPLSACAPSSVATPADDAAGSNAAATPATDTSQDAESASQESDGAAPAETAPPASDGQSGETAEDSPHSPNVLLLISDEKNDIEDFEELWVTISGIGFVLGDEEGIEEYVLDPVESVNLVAVQGEDAVALWEGYVPAGDYTKVFLYVDEVWGIMAGAEEGDDPVEIKLPSNKLQLVSSLRVDEQEEEGEGETEGDEEPTAEFVFDITVHSAGNSGQYILSPQASESGQGKTYRLLEHTEERIMKGKPDFTGKRDTTGKPEWASQPGGRGLDDEEETEEQS